MQRGYSYDAPASLPVATNAHDFNFEADLFTDTGEPLSLDDATLTTTLRFDGASDPLNIALTTEVNANTLSVYAPASAMKGVEPGTYFFTITAVYPSSETVALIRARLPVVRG